MATILVGLLFTLGGLLITALFTPKPKDTYGTRLSDINVTAVSPGNIIPRVWGTMKVPCQLIFCSPLIETMHTHQASKKGGGKGIFGGHAAKSYTFTYSVDVCFSVCAGPIYQLQRIWSNQKLIWVNPLQAAQTQAEFDAAYQSEATRLIDQEGVQLDYAASSAFVFAFNNFDTGEVTLTSPSQAVSYITSHPIDDTAGITGMILYPDAGGVTAIIAQMYSGLNNQLQYESTINRFDLIEIYQGDELQIPNGLLEGYLGSGNAPGFRGCCYFVITNLQLMDFGNNLPSFTATAQFSANGVTTLTEIISDVCFEAGLAKDQFDCLSQVNQGPIPGFCVTTNTSPRAVLEDLQKAFSLDAAETGGILLFSMTNRFASMLIDRGDLGAHVDTDALPTSEEVTRTSDYDLPYRINFSYQEPARNYSKNTVYWQRSNSVSQSVEDISVSIGLDRTTAQAQVINLLVNRMFQRRTYKMFLPRKYVALDATDVVRMLAPGSTDFHQQYYCTQVQIGANGVIQADFTDHFYMDPNFVPTEQVGNDLLASTGTNDTIPGTSATMCFLFDCPFLLDNDTDQLGFYVMLAGAFNKWQGGGLYVDVAQASITTAYGLSSTTLPAGSNWFQIGSSQQNVPWGTVLTPLSNVALPGYWDNISVITVYINNQMELQSASEYDMLTQSLNVTFIGKELVQYANAVNLGNGMWRLSGFLRGLRNTEMYMGSHTSGENFVRIASTLIRVPTTESDLNVENTFVGMSLYATNETQQSFTFEDTGTCLKPPTVYVTEKFRDNDDNIFLTWYPRARQNGEWLDDDDIVMPTNELPEEYSIDVLSAPNGTVLKTFNGISGTLGVTGWEYTAAAQTSDLGAPPVPMYLAIYQISTLIGRGFGIGVTI